MVGQENVITIEKQENDPVYLLKMKCNLQVDKIHELQDLLDKERKKNILLEDEIKKYEQPTVNNFDSFDMENEFVVYMNFLFRILKKIIENNEFIAYKNYTKNSARYCKVEKNIFESYLDEDPNIDKKTFFNFCVDFALLKADENRKCIWNDNQDSQSVRIYFISKALINILNGDYIDVE
jgi:hypothetical protein